MKDIVYDGGIQEFAVGDGVLRFNPSDPNVYARMSQVGEKIQAVTADVLSTVTAGADPDGVDLLRLMGEMDRKLKDVLCWIFGPGNDFDAIFSGVNIMSLGSNGERVITNFLNAIAPVMERGAQECAQRLVSDAVADAETDRALRGVTQ